MNVSTPVRRTSYLSSPLVWGSIACTALFCLQPLAQMYGDRRAGNELSTASLIPLAQQGQSQERDAQLFDAARALCKADRRVTSTSSCANILFDRALADAKRKPAS